MAPSVDVEHERLGGTYDEFADAYTNAWQESESILPIQKLENELTEIALGDCTGLRILDLAGGTGGHARQAIAAGCKNLDLVDISEGMLNTGRKIEADAGRDIIQWYKADIMIPLADQVPSLPQHGYNLVMAMWPFDHATCIQDLEGMWENISHYLRSGGKFVTIRMANPHAECAKEGKYGTKLIDITPIEGGVKLKYTVYTNPPFTLEASSMEASYGGSKELATKYGIVDVRAVDIAKTKVFMSDPGYWKQVADDPFYVVETGSKK